MRIRFFALIISTVCAFGSFAFANTSELESRVLNRSDRVNRLLNRRAHRMTEYELREVLQHLRAISHIVRDEDDSNDRPPARGLSSLDILAAGGFNLSSTEDASKVMNEGILVSGISQLVSIKDSCSPTRTWGDNYRCLRDSIRSLQNRGSSHYNVTTETARQMIYKMCQKTKTWANEARCFRDSVAQTNYAIRDLVIGCRNLSSSESVSRCYRGALN